MRKLTPLALQEIASNKGFTHYLRIKVGDAELTAQTTNNTAATITVKTIPKNTVIVAAELVPVKPFKNASDTAFNSNTLSVGDAGSATRYINAAQLNANGTPITEPVFYNTPYGPLTADTDLAIVLNSMSGKKISDLTEGEAVLFLQLLNTDTIAKLK